MYRKSSKTMFVPVKRGQKHEEKYNLCFIKGKDNLSYRKHPYETKVACCSFHHSIHSRDHHVRIMSYQLPLWNGERPLPGQCPRYIDISGDGICDLSQATAAATTTDTSSTSTDDTTTTTNSGNGHGANSDTIQTSHFADANATTIPDSTGLDSGNLQVDTTNYYVLPVTIILIGGYLFTHYLFNKGILKQNKHRRIWNLLVTAGYLGTGVTGILLTIMINLGIRTALSPSITYWHAEMAILMVVGTMIHIHLYWKPFKNMFRVLFGIKSNLKKNPTKLKKTSHDVP